VASDIFDATKRFAEAVRVKFAADYDTWPEDQLKTPIDNFLVEVGALHNLVVVANTEAPQKAEGQTKSDGRVDVAVRVDSLLTGHIELKAPGLGADPAGLKAAHNKKQWERFKRLPNLIYTDGRSWSHFRKGVRVGEIVCFQGDPVKDGDAAISPEDAASLGGRVPVITAR
jgi:hypothetical protein